MGSLSELELRCLFACGSCVLRLDMGEFVERIKQELGCQATAMDNWRLTDAEVLERKRGRDAMRWNT